MIQRDRTELMKNTIKVREEHDTFLLMDKCQSLVANYKMQLHDLKKEDDYNSNSSEVEDLKQLIKTCKKRMLEIKKSIDERKMSAQDNQAEHVVMTQDSIDDNNASSLSESGFEKSR